MKRVLIFLACVAVMLGWRGMGAPLAHAQGASLYIGPATGSFVVGNTFTVSVYLNSGGDSINAIQADLSFPADKLQVVSPSTGNSFVQIWMAQPSYSNVNGTLSFQGAVPTPGINTNAGLVSTITFRVMNTGTAVVKFLDSSKVLLNNGQGTNILSQTTDGIYTLTVPPPAGPEVTSPTNPDQSAWYPSQSVVLDWSSGADGYSYILDNSPVTTPDDTSEGAATHLVYNNLADGLYYFHIKALQGGKWGGVTHFAVRVDNAPPAAFSINVSPGTYTSDQDPVITFQTTDAVSGIDHYELKFISLDLPASSASQNTAPFFIEASSPYSQHLALGRYEVVVRAYNLAGNYYQATQNISIVNPLFQIVGTSGLSIGGPFMIPWPYVALIGILIILLLVYGILRLWKLHRAVEIRLEQGAARHPDIAQKLTELKAKQKEYEEALKKLPMVLLAIGVTLSLGIRFAHAAPAPSSTAPSDIQSATAVPGTQSFAPNPPLINLYPSSLANDEVLYLGGWANVPGAKVVIYIEQTETGNTYSGTATPDSDGNWFYSFPQLVDAGHYVAWADLVAGNQTSAPSARVDIAVAPTALQIGSARLDVQQLYLLLFIIFLVIALVLGAILIRYLRRIRMLRGKLEDAIQEAEDSLRRGFSLLRKDIEKEFAYIQKVKGERGLSAEERAREEKVKRDIADIDEYVGREIWKIEEEEKRIKL